MPSALTNGIYEGTADFKSYLKEIIRYKYGIVGEPIPLAPLKEKALQAAKNELEYWSNLSEAEQRVKYEEIRIGTQHALETTLTRQLAVLGRYKDMLAKIEAWQAPSVLKDVKDLMIRQIEESMSNDCWAVENMPKNMSEFEEWRELYLATLKRDVEREQEIYDYALRYDAERQKIYDAVKGYYA